MRAARQLVNLPVNSSAIRSASRRYNNDARPDLCIRLPGRPSTSLLVPLARIVSTICIQHSSVSFSTIPTETMESCCIYSSPNSSSTAQYRLFSTDPSEDGRNLDAKIAKLELEIADVANQIEKAEASIASAKAKKDLNYFRTEKKQLRAKEDRLRAKEELLLKIKMGQDAPLSFSKQKYLDCGRSFVRSIMKPGTVKELIDASGKHMSVLVGVQPLDPGSPPVDVFVRSVTEPFWEYCFTMAEQRGLRVCAVGSPGIGKSFSSLFAIKLLLDKGKTVVYLCRTDTKSGAYYQFTPSSSGIAVDVFPEMRAPADVPSLAHPDSFYIVDPGMTEDSCNPSSGVKAHVIICSSLDCRHWGDNEFHKTRFAEGICGGTFCYYPVWDLHELLVAGEHFAATSQTDSGSVSRTPEDKSFEVNCSPEAIKLRFWQFGGIPRIVFGTDPALISTHEFKQTSGVNSLSDRHLREICQGQVDVDAFKPDAPRSTVVAYTVAPGQWRYPQAVFVSDRVECRVAEKYDEGFWNYIFATGDSTIKGIRFENYTRAWLLREQRGSLKLKYISQSESKEPTKEPTIPQCQSSVMLMASGAAVSQWEACTEDYVLYYSKSTQAPVTDFVIKEGDTCYVINSTVQKKRKMEESLLLRFCDSVSKNANGNLNFCLIFVVPNFDEFNNFTFSLTKKTTKTITAKGRKKQNWTTEDSETATMSETKTVTERAPLPKNCDVWVAMIGPGKKESHHPQH